jgi:hypothetical protein
MGISSDAMLYFGFPVGGEDEPPAWLEGYQDFDDYVCTDVPANAGWEIRSPIVKACPAELFTYCSYDYPMHILGVRGAEHRVYRGYHKDISVADLTAVSPARILAFKNWCEGRGIEWHEPRWLLCSMYG